MNIDALEASAQPVAQASGLAGVVVADTRLSLVDGERGELFIAGTRAELLAESTEFEAVAERLLALARGDDAPHGEDAPHTGLQAELARARARAYEGVPALEGCLVMPDAMDALLAATAQARSGRDALSVLGALPVYVAAGARLRAQLPTIAPNPSFRHAEDFLSMLGLPADAARARALDAYWVTVSDHSLNASTFAARVVASTGSDIVSSIAAALGALKGPLHGGAPGPVLDMLDATRAVEPRKWLESELSAGRRIMGMGHRIYRVRDPRAFVFERALSQLERQLAADGRSGGARDPRPPGARAPRRSTPHKPCSASAIRGARCAPTSNFTPPSCSKHSASRVACSAPALRLAVARAGSPISRNNAGPADSSAPLPATPAPYPDRPSPRFSPPDACEKLLGALSIVEC